jgi:hypothetical protein
LPATTASCASYNLNAGTYVPAKDRGGLEFHAEDACLRDSSGAFVVVTWPIHPLRGQSLALLGEQRADGTVVLGLKRAWSDGTANTRLRRKVVPRPREARSERKRVP